VRRCIIDLSPFLACAGLDSAPSVADLLALLGHPCAPGGPVWVAGEGVGVLDIESLGLRGSGVMAFLVALGVVILSGGPQRLRGTGAERSLSGICRVPRENQAVHSRPYLNSTFTTS